MEFEVSYSLDNEEQFWEELSDILSSDSTDHELIDNALRSYLSFTTKFKGARSGVCLRGRKLTDEDEYLQSEYDVARSSYRLTQSALFKTSKEYVRRQIVYGLLQEEDAPTLHMIAAFLLIDGRSDDETLRMMQTEGVFPRLVELTQEEQIQEDPSLHRTLLELLYEMSRIQRLTWEDLTAVNDTFVLYLFQVIEGASDDVNDPYHYPIIRVLLVLNEQYMVSSTHPAKGARTPTPLTNRVIKALSTHGTSYKTFGCNLILLLNRESETSLQLLILKLLYLLFQSTYTAEYFYTNDLYVLLDVILRNLLDLPSDSPPAAALRHTYLRVLHPLLANSQLATPPHYKRAEVLKMLSLLADSGTHFAPVDETTMRLVTRCTSVPWLVPKTPLNYHDDDNDSPTTPQATEGADEPSSSPEKGAAGAGQRELARRMLGMSVKGEGASESTLSVVQVAEHMAKPGEVTPSRGFT
ncbi:hypothetical protein EJ05DRAFT_449090 [Pseudovirgaria hyperparasitica]|uniref:SPIN90/Ldb17 leucine-rich domain-containing protein n=1 Tax=Pseudovirgaria hyperparasitica TaxID=470096 RepID=A0A6A6WFN8_9PEZI|nr:uncharacterized protein EJ05DRAFT_449090 [Pseudovirgaria hyperparasitica]KAF2760864.1 hypothetical protein EJ05DRAFT_449090 [Pseudovirgaria hyperparasitica]